jgi:hypothetical protein
MFDNQSVFHAGNLSSGFVPADMPEKAAVISATLTPTTFG